jgi:azurin
MRKITNFCLVLSILCPAVSNFSSAAIKPAKNLEIGTKGNAIAFDQEQLNATVNQKIRLTFKNNSTQGTKMQHSWVLSRPGTEVQVAASAASAGSEKNYIPNSPDVLAYTRLLDPGESQTITFQAPSQPGKYPFICTFPGHSTSMKGTLEVK